MLLILWLRHKALVRSSVFYFCPAREFSADTHLLKLQRLQNKVFRNSDKFSMRTPICDLNVAFKIPYM
jgi:hypothetical protein